MPDTGAPWEIPYLDGTELVRAYPAFSEDLAEQIADGLDAAGGLVAVKHAIRTAPESFTSVTQGDNRTVSGLSISHALADAGNKLIISAYFGTVGHSNGQGQVAIGVHDGAGFIGVGDADGGKTRVGAGGSVTSFNNGDAGVIASRSVMFVYEPGDTNPRTYTVRAINARNDTATLFINRSQADLNNAAFTRSSSALVIQEVKV